jgi:hypothetical protein
LAEDAIKVLEDRGYIYDDIEFEVELRFPPAADGGAHEAVTKTNRYRYQQSEAILYTKLDELESKNVSSLERKVRSDPNKRAAKRRTIFGLMFIEYKRVQKFVERLFSIKSKFRSCIFRISIIVLTCVIYHSVKPFDLIHQQRN